MIEVTRAIRRVAICFFISVAVLLVSCSDPNAPYDYDFYIAQYLSLNSLRGGVSIQPPKPIARVGKILVHANHVFLVDSLRGIHVVDCSNPAAPISVAFIAIPGANGFTISDDVLYADSYIDLLTFDISVPAQPRLRNRVENAFPQVSHASELRSTNIDSGVVTGWLHVKGSILSYDDGVAVVQTNEGERTRRVEVVNPALYARTTKDFEAVGNTVYVGVQNELWVLDISNRWAPMERSRIVVGWSVANTFVHRDNLYVGTDYDVFLYDITNPSSPLQRYRWHAARACDQLAASDNIMYVAERGNAGCNSYKNILYAVDNTDQQYGEFVIEQELTEPYALKVEANRLYVCDGVGGLKVYDISTASKPVFSGSYPVVDCRNVVTIGTTAVVVARDGIHILDCANPAAIAELSVLKMTQ